MPALLYDPEAYSLSGPKLMGRNAAGHSFLRGLMRHSSEDQLVAFVGQESHAKAFKNFALEEKGTKPVITIGNHQIEQLRDAGTLYLPGPGLDISARHRALIDPVGWSLCGITHTTLSARAMDAISGLLTSPVAPWDALICTSRAVHDTVTKVLDAEAEYLQMRLGATRFAKPQLPIIPLGLNTDDFHKSDNDRGAARKLLGIRDDETVILFVGRLSFHAKAHPAPMYQALQRVSASNTITLIECGWFANASIENAFSEAASLIAPHVKRIVLDGRKAEARKLAWHVADIFMSLTDNLQETFGITPIEAMASGLPVIVSDWDGYRDTVRDSVDGFRIPSIMPHSAISIDSGQRYARDLLNYDHYCGETSHFVAIDIDATTHALERLVNNPELRRSMGGAGQAYARAEFDWSHIIPRYEALWAGLAERRAAEAVHSLAPRYPWPARMNPFDAFSSYPTRSFDTSTAFRRRDASASDAIMDYRRLNIYTISNGLLIDDHVLKRIMNEIPIDQTITLQELSILTGEEPVALTSLIMFGLKIGCLVLGF